MSNHVGNTRDIDCKHLPEFYVRDINQICRFVDDARIVDKQIRRTVLLEALRRPCIDRRIIADIKRGELVGCSKLFP